MHGTGHVPCTKRHPHRGFNSGRGHLRYGVWDLVRDRSSVRDASAGLETMNSGGQDIDFGAQQVVLGVDKLHAGTADSFLYGRPSPPHTPTEPHPPSGSSCPPIPAASARPRLSTRTQCTIRAPARDHELHTGPGSRKRSGVSCGISGRAWSLWRRHSPYILLRAFCFTGEARMPWGGGVRREIRSLATKLVGDEIFQITCR